MSEVENRPPVIDYEGSDYQQAFWEHGGREYEDQAEGIALRRLLPAAGRLMLELGAGAGRNTLRYQGFDRIVVLDYSFTQLQQAQARLGRVDRYIYVAADAYRLPFVPSLFDAATMIRVLHHMAEPEKVLRQVRQALQPCGLFILEFASKHNLKAILRYSLGRQEWSPFTPEPVEFVHLNYDFHPAQVRRWLGETGFRVERQLTVSHFRLDALKRAVPMGMLLKLESLAQLTGDWWQLSPSVFVAARAVGETAQAPGRGIFRCPECEHFPLDETPQECVCPACGRRWALIDGIYDFRQPVEPNA